MADWPEGQLSLRAKSSAPSLLSSSKYAEQTVRSNASSDLTKIHCFRRIHLDPDAGLQVQSLALGLATVCSARPPSRHPMNTMHRFVGGLTEPLQSPTLKNRAVADTQHLGRANATT